MNSGFDLMCIIVNSKIMDLISIYIIVAFKMCNFLVYVSLIIYIISIYIIVIFLISLSFQLLLTCICVPIDCFIFLFCFVGQKC